MSVTPKIEKVEICQGPFDQSEIAQIRERVLIRDSCLNRLDDRVKANEGKLRRIWVALAIAGVLIGAWVDGRFGLTVPNAVSAPASIAGPP